MKRILLVWALALSSLAAKAQVIVDGVDINTKADIEYIEIVGTQVGVFTRKIVVVVDYGQKFEFGEAQTITGADGKPAKFLGITDALNFMVHNGWEYVNQYIVTIGNQNAYHFLLRRKH